MYFVQLNRAEPTLYGREASLNLSLSLIRTFKGELDLELRCEWGRTKRIMEHRDLYLTSAVYDWMGVSLERLVETSVDAHSSLEQRSQDASLDRFGEGRDASIAEFQTHLCLIYLWINLYMIC